jgi:hypothetical protein
MKILKAIVIISRVGADNISLQTDLPEGCYTTDDKERMCLSFKVTKGLWSDYLKEHFPDIPVEIVDCTKPRIKLHKEKKTVKIRKEEEAGQGEWGDCSKCGMKGSGGWCCWVDKDGNW